MEPDLNNPEQIKLLISILQKLLPQEATEQPKPVKKKKPKQTKENNTKNIIDEFDNPNIKTKSTKISTNSKNKFLDMPEMSMHKSDSVIDRKLAVSPPTPRTRKFVPVNARCRVCGKTEKINPAIIPDTLDRYKCNKCSATAAG